MERIRRLTPNPSAARTTSSGQGAPAIAAFARRYGFQSALILALAWIATAHTQSLVAGLISGVILGMGALGLTLTYGVLKFPNLAHGLSMMLAAYLTFFFYTGQVQRSATSAGDVVVPLHFGALPGATDPIAGLSFGYGLIPAIIASAVVLTLVFLATDRLVFSRIRRRGRDSVLLLTIVSFGLAYVVISVIDLVWSPNLRHITLGAFPATKYPFGIQLKDDQLFVFAAAIVCTGATFFVIYRTKMGRAMRAMSDNVSLARASGIPVGRVVVVTWIIVGAVTGISGSLLGVQAGLYPQLGLQLLLPLFAAAAVGGIGNPLGALVGGLIVGIAQELAVNYVNAGYKIGVAFMILVIVLLFRPNGLFGSAGFLQTQE
ncbi:MAG: branched-chain amino acid transport system permease protein [Chloroflexota bacterium]|jgi:branched-subunit amino acid ABC-type transport system permease component|nr:branched-chain amino acid transport system permease protein [Chloroflexota bacterium]